MAEKKKYKAWLRQGDPLLIVTAALLAALGDADAFPQDRAGIEALIAAIPKGPEGEEVRATYEDPSGPLTYLGGHGKWVAPAGEGRLRIRMQALDDELASRVWTLGPDGSLGDPETINGYGVPDDELPPEAVAELEQMERRRQEFEAQIPEMERRTEEHQNRHRLEHLLGVAAGPAGQDPGGPVVTHVLLYDTGLIVRYLTPGSAPESVSVDDGLGTKFRSDGGGGGWGGEGPRRGHLDFTPAVPADADRLVFDLDGTQVTIELGRP